MTANRAQYTEALGLSNDAYRAFTKHMSECSACLPVRTDCPTRDGLYDAAQKTRQVVEDTVAGWSAEPPASRAARLETKARATIAARTTRQLCSDFAATEASAGKTRETSMVRGWLMEELEKRSPQAFDAWMSSDQSLPRDFYNA